MLERVCSAAQGARFKRGVAVSGLLSLAVWVVGASDAVAYERYSDGCNTCHGSFSSGTSPKGTIFPNNNKHTMHRNSAYMATACNACHSSGGYSPVYLGSSAGTPNNPGLGCSGCHGEYYGATIGYKGAGLRRHHAVNSVTVCVGCHSDDPLPIPEGVNPKYYGTVDTHADDACNAAPLYKENWSVGDTVGQDNDGDNLYDELDPDCGAAGPGDTNCDGVVDFGDINPFVQALSDPAGYEAAYPGCNILHCDISGDGQVNFDDINPFVALLSGG